MTSSKQLQGEPEPNIFPVGPFEDRSKRYDDVIRFFTEAYFFAPIEKQMRMISAAGGIVYYYTNDFRFYLCYNFSTNLTYT